ncbi:glycosyltransferase family 4 protein [Rhodanobacter sp. B2A1Ga4]|uniref:glycosyltransferase family 4 protein n=1 Tax=Rhodanobacter sp. B2A1Ga4 TaxID=2778647 RepID=UPI001B37C58A|nr:glycosyltransferase family 4 protein [Rhodanobacter sp. B2A1Ga4]MBQ4856058.1 glycosyltransferase family 4 protein [Rhodanobacter sp. B2A1Ga4]
MARINLLAWDNQRGLSHDIRLLSTALVALGHQVHVTRLGPHRHDGRRKVLLLYLRMWWQRLRHADWRATPYDINIALEHVRPDWFGLARWNLLVPNPEWLSPRSQRYLARYDAILCKTHHAVGLFTARGCRALHIGFRSTDCLQPEVPRQPTFLHLAGASRMKGTQRLLALWRRHPEWPKLLVLQSPRTATPPSGPVPANIEHRIGYPGDVREIRRLQNAHLFHLCLSETEGWGHYLVEAMSCAAVVIASDAPPMNELVTPARGVLVGASDAGPFNLATLHRFDEAALEAAIERLLAMPAHERAALGEQARAWFESNEASFAARLDAALRQLG